MHVNSSDIEENEELAALEVNGSYEPSKLKAKLFMDYNYLHTERSGVHHGDPVKLFHKEAKGHLTVSQRDVDLLLPLFPDFLQK